MKNILLAAFALLAATPALAAERLYSVTDFDRVRIEGPYQVTLSTGGSSSASATGSQPGIDRLLMDVQSGVLRIRPNPSTWGENDRGPVGPVAIRVSTRTLRGAAIVGSGTLAVDKAGGLRLDLSVSGSGTLAVASVDADNLVVGLLGSGRIMLAGRTKQLRAAVQGSGDLDAAGLKADDAIINADTAGTIKLAAVRTAKVRAGGTGDVEISGTPSCTIDGLGAGTVRCGRQ